MGAVPIGCFIWLMVVEGARGKKSFQKKKIKNNSGGNTVIMTMSYCLDCPLRSSAFLCALCASAVKFSPQRRRERRGTQRLQLFIYQFLIGHRTPIPYLFTRSLHYMSTCSKCPVNFYTAINLAPFFYIYPGGFVIYYLNHKYPFC